jgi:hypothetical protein
MYNNVDDRHDFLNVTHEVELSLTYPQAYIASEDPIAVVRHVQLPVDADVVYQFTNDDVIWGGNVDFINFYWWHVYGGQWQPSVSVCGLKVPFIILADPRMIRARIVAKEERVFDIQLR